MLRVHAKSGAADRDGNRSQRLAHGPQQLVVEGAAAGAWTLEQAKKHPEFDTEILDLRDVVLGLVLLYIVGSMYYGIFGFL